LVEGALRARVVIVGATILALIFGARAVTHVPLDVFPDFAPPQVTIQTEAPGFSAEQVEGLVTRPIEAALAGAMGLDTLRSQSIQGLSIVTAVFRDDVDPQRARQALAEQLAGAAQDLPAGVEAPRLTPLTSSTMDLLKVGLVSTRLSPMELRSFAQWTVRPRLIGVTGVAGMSLFGGVIEQLQVQVDPERLTLLGFDLTDVLEAVRNATGVVGSGFVETPAQRVTIEAHGQFDEPAELARVVLGVRDGRTLFLGDVAEIVPGPEPLFGDTLIQGQPGVLLTLLSQYGANTWEVTHRVEAALEELQPLFVERGIEVYPRLHRPATFIEHSLANLRSSLVLGAVLVALVLFAFLLDLRTALISLVAIPLSLGAALLVLERTGATLNTITLGGLVIALGEVVDDAIIDVGNILRRLRANAAAGSPRSAFDVVLAASLEVRRPVVHGTFVVALAFLPVLGMTGLQGKLFAPLAQAYLLAIGASLLVALIVTPALALVLLPAAPAPARELAPLRLLRRGYTRLLHSRIAPRLAFGLLAALGAVGAWAVPRLGLEFLPKFREGHFVLQLSSAPGTSLAEMKRVGARVAAALLANPHIATVEQQIGRTELGEDPWGTHRSEFHVELRSLPPRVEAGVEGEIRAALAQFPGLRSEVLTFLGDRIGETLSGETAQVVFSLFGEDLEAIDRTAEQLSAALASVPGAVDVQTSSAPSTPTVEIALRNEDLARHGLRPLSVLTALRVAFHGERVAQNWIGERVRDVVVVLEPGARDEPERVADLRLRTLSGGSVALGDVADVRTAEGRSSIAHEGGRRRATVTCNVEGRDVAAFDREASARLRSVPLPPGSYLVLGGAGPAESHARRELVALAFLALAAIGLVLYTTFSSPRMLALLLLDLPFALLGGALAAWFAGTPLSLGSLIGFVTVFGISARTGILLLAHFQHLVDEEGQEWGLETVVRGAQERLVPILMTASVTGLGLLPLALQSGAAGREIEGPMASVILGGLVTSTVLNLLVLPSLALRFARPDVAR